MLTALLIVALIVVLFGFVCAMSLVWDGSFFGWFFIVRPMCEGLGEFVGLILCGIATLND